MSRVQFTRSTAVQMMGSYIVLILFAFLVEGVFGDEDEVMSVMKGNHVTLNTGVTKNPGDVFLWYFEDTLIAQINGHPENSCLYYGKGEIFKDRLEVDYATGSLIITTSRPEHTGRYQAEFIKHDSTSKTETIIRSSKCDQTKIYPKGSDLVIQKSFNLTVSGVFGEVMSVMKGNHVTLNTGVTKNPDDTLLWYFEYTLIAQIKGQPENNCLYYYYGKDEIFKDRLDMDHKTGSLIITTSRPEHTGRYQAEFIKGKPGKTETIIRSSKCDQTKIYPKRSDLVIHKSFILIVSGVFGEVMSVIEGNHVTLNTGVTKNPGDVFLWYFEYTLIALVNCHPENNSLYYYYDKDKIFKDRLEVDYATGSLIITNITSEHTGRYEAEFIKHDSTSKTETIIRNSKCDQTKINPKGSDLVIQKSFSLTVSGVFGDEDEVMSVMKGNHVTLNTGVTKNPGDVFLWYFEDTLIAQINGHPGKSCLYYGKGEIFKDRLEVDYATGSLIITTSRPEHTGRYQAEFIKHDNTGKTKMFNRTTQKCDHTKINPKGSDLVIHKSFSLTVSGVFGEVMSVMKGNRVTLNTGVTKSPDDTLLWYFEYTLIALVKGQPENNCLYYYYGKDEIFKDRLEVDHKTGSLIITTSRPEHTGRYQAEFIEEKPGKTKTINTTPKCDHTKINPKGSNLVIHKSFILTVSDEVMSVMEGNRVTLNTGVTKSPDNILLWYFEDTLIALINGHPSTSCLYYGEGEIFKDRLDVDHKTGSLIITTSRPEHTGRYEAEFIEGKPGKTKTIIRSSKCDHTKINPKGSDLVIHKSFSLTVSAVPDSGPSSDEIAGIVVGVLLLVAAAVGVMIYRRRSSRNDIKKKVPDQVSEEKLMI